MRIPAMPFLASLDHLVLTVSDLQRTLDFYCGVLGCEEVTFGDKRKAIRFGDQKINLHVKGNEIVPHALCPAPGSADLCFLSTVPVAPWPDTSRRTVLRWNWDRSSARAQQETFYLSTCATLTATSSRLPIANVRLSKETSRSGKTEERSASCWQAEC